MENIYTENEMIRIMYCKQKATEPHRHDYLEMVFVMKGKGVHILNGKKTVVEKGDYFIIDYGAYHKYTTIGNTGFEIINVLFKPEIIDKSLVNCKSFRDLLNNYLIRFSYQTLSGSPTNVVYRDDDNIIFDLIRKIGTEYDNKNAGYLEIMRCYIIEILINTVRKIKKEDANILYNDYSKFIMDCVDENYMTKITLSDISKRLNFSLPYMCKRFKSDTGMSFNEYLQKKRIEQSCRLISNTDKKISEIAELVGYGDIKFFNQIFKKHLKMTPREFKKRR